MATKKIILLILENKILTLCNFKTVLKTKVKINLILQIKIANFNRNHSNIQAIIKIK